MHVFETEIAWLWNECKNDKATKDWLYCNARENDNIAGKSTYHLITISSRIDCHMTITKSLFTVKMFAIKDQCNGYGTFFNPSSTTAFLFSEKKE
jgi:hypothetical protein